jgi:hypothetical protein
MRWGYHLTYQSDLPSIQREGLRVQPDLEESWGNDPAVYFVSVVGVIGGAPFNAEYSAWIRFPWPNDTPLPRSGSSIYDEYRTRNNISAESIEVLMSGDEFPASADHGSEWVSLSAFKFTRGRR